jgi:phage antirepressor YoqD-like protein
VNAALEQQKAELNAENLKLIEAVKKQHETLQVVESMFDTDGCMEMKDAVKVLKEYFCDEGSSLVGRNKLFAFLRDTKILMENNLPYQDYSKHFVVNVSTGTIYLKNKSLVWLKRFVSKRVPKKASVLQISHARKMFDLNIQD